MKIFIYTCDKNLFLLDTTITMVNKYFNPNPEIIILGFKNPNLKHHNVKFVSLGETQDVNKWSMYLYKYFKEINDDYVLTLFENMFPIDHVNVDGIKTIIKYMQDNKNIGVCTLCNQPGFGRDKNEEIIIDNNNLFLYKIPKKPSFKKLNLQVNLWNRKYFLKYLSHSVNPWNFEIELSKLAQNDNYYTLSTSNYKNNTKCVFPSQVNTALSQNHWKGKISVIGMKKKDIEYLIDKKYLDKSQLIYGSYNYYKDYEEINFKNFNIKKFIENAPKNLKIHWINSFYKYYSKDLL